MSTYENISTEGKISSLAFIIRASAIRDSLRCDDVLKLKYLITVRFNCFSTSLIRWLFTRRRCSHSQPWSRVRELIHISLPAASRTSQISSNRWSERTFALFAILNLFLRIKQRRRDFSSIARIWDLCISDIYESERKTMKCDYFRNNLQANQMCVMFLTLIVKVGSSERV